MQKDKKTEEVSSECIDEQCLCVEKDDLKGSKVSEALGETEGEIRSLDADYNQEKKIIELNDSLLRLKADFENFKKRTQKEKDDLSSLIKVNIISKLLTVIDNFERGISTAETQDSMAFKTGMEMIYKQLLGFLEEIGVEQIQTKDELFDPQFHQAVMRIEDETKEEGRIVAELQRGYRVDEKLIRPSMVQVVGN